MKFKSTRNQLEATLDQALLTGLAADGGLYVPAELPTFSLSEFPAGDDVGDIARHYLAPFFADSALRDALDEIIAETYAFPLPLVDLSAIVDAPLSVLELFHGPTAAFKDVGAGFLAACLTRLDAATNDPLPLTILVATSGDTGGAVASAFHQRPGTEVIVLFPNGRVSPRQQHQLTCWGDNVRAFAVEGEFDDCQRMVKEAFVDASLTARFRFSSANSINIGRLLPQSVYYVLSSLAYYRRHGEPLSFLIPTGNLGNGLAAVLARACGLPIGDITLVTNENRTISDFMMSGEYQPRSSVATLASAMDVGAPSNLERLRYLFGDNEALRRLNINAVSVSDDAIRERIRADADRMPFAWCPHSATAMHVWAQQDSESRQRHQAVVATAHPAKFETIVEPIIGSNVAVPESLAALLHRPANFQTIAPNLADLIAAVSQA
ncbi:MAG: threonine synthase [Pseudomonadota bacterium]